MNFRKNILLIIFILLIKGNIVYSEDSALPVEDLAHYCKAMYESHQTCPKEICFLSCLGGIDSQDCPVECQAKECIEIDAKDCPQPQCDLIEGCDKKKVCYYKIRKPPSGCGDLSYVGQNDCCQGFVKRCGIEFFDGTCDMVGEKSIYSSPMCIPCGNGICNQFENHCNCPEDCS